MNSILSIQSHVAYGYVGNRVATFTLQRLGHPVISMNTVQFSNHTGYGDWEGDIFSLQHLEKLWEGLLRRKAASQIKALLTGYLGHESFGGLIKEILSELKNNNPNFIYCLDPVLGDVGRGVFVREELANFFKESFVYNGSVITPNHFEYNFLCQNELNEVDQLKEHAKRFFDKGIKKVLVTSYKGRECETQEIGVVLLSPDESYFIKTPQINFEIPPNGSGDLISSLFLDEILKGTNDKLALEEIASKMFRVFEMTKKLGERELQIIKAQDILIQEKVIFEAQKI